jgi:hypothetical protein
VCKTEYDANYGIVFTSDNEHVLNVTASVTRLAAAAARADAHQQAKLLSVVRKQLKKGAGVMEGWRVPANHSFTGAIGRCLGSIYDALLPAVQPVPEPKPVLADARAYVDVMQEEEPGYYGMGGAGV